MYPERSGVIVETAKGLEYGTVVFGVREVSDEEIVHPLKPVLRRANQKDEKIVKEHEEKIPEVMKITAEKIQARKSEDLANGFANYIIRIGISKFIVKVNLEKIEYVMDLC